MLNALNVLKSKLSQKCNKNVFYHPISHSKQRVSKNTRPSYDFPVERNGRESNPQDPARSSRIISSLGLPHAPPFHLVWRAGSDSNRCMHVLRERACSTASAPALHSNSQSELESRRHTKNLTMDSWRTIVGLLRRTKVPKHPGCSRGFAFSGVHLSGRKMYTRGGITKLRRLPRRLKKSFGTEVRSVVIEPTPENVTRFFRQRQEISS